MKQLIYEGNNLKFLRNPFLWIMMILTGGLLLVVFLIYSKKYPRKIWIENGKLFTNTPACEQGIDFHLSYLKPINYRTDGIKVGSAIQLWIPRNKGVPIDFSSYRSWAATTQIIPLANQFYIPRSTYRQILPSLLEAGMNLAP